MHPRGTQCHRTLLRSAALTQEEVAVPFSFVKKQPRRRALEGGQEGGPVDDGVLQMVKANQEALADALQALTLSSEDDPRHAALKNLLEAQQQVLVVLAGGDSGEGVKDGASSTRKDGEQDDNVDGS